MKRNSKEHIFIILLIACILIQFIHAFANAQPPSKRGKTNIKPYKEELKRARKGDVAAMLTLAAVYRGQMLDSDQQKDYKNALKWYQKALASNPTPEQLFEIKLNLFRLYFTGGYGIEQDLTDAKTYSAEATALNPLPLISEYQPNLHLAEFFNLYHRAQAGDKSAAVLAAMMAFRYHIDYRTAIHLLQLAADDPDAAYLKERYEAEMLRYRQNGHMYLERSALLPLLRRYAQQGSMLAKTEFAYEVLQPSQYVGPRLKSEEVNAFMSDMKQWKASYAVEMQLKALCLLTYYQTGNERIFTLQKIAAINAGLPSEELKFAQPFIKELRQFEQKASTVEGLAELQQTHQLTGFNIDLQAWNHHFNGEVKQLLSQKAELEKPIVAQLVGNANVENYRVQLQRKAIETLEQATSPRRLIAFYDEIKKNTWLQSIRPSLLSQAEAQLSQLGVDQTNMLFFYAQSTIEETKFTSLAEGQQVVSRLLAQLPQPQPVPSHLSKVERLAREQQNRKIATEQARLISFAKVKIIRDLLGEAPTVEQIERAKFTIFYDPWLQPEGEQMFFYYTSNSPNWFSGEVKRGNLFYYYKVTRIGTSDRFRLEIQVVANNKSNLVFNSIIKTTHSADGTIEVDIMGSRMTGYAWDISENDYLTCIFRPNQPTLDLQPFGYVARCVDRNHGYTPDFPRQKVDPNDFSERNAIRSAVRAFILEYHNALRPI